MTIWRRPCAPTRSVRMGWAPRSSRGDRRKRRSWRTGCVTVNDVIAPTAHPATPFGGLGHSGWGVTQGAEGLLEMTVPQVVSVRGGTFRPHYDFAVGKASGNEELMRGLLHMSHGAGFLQRWRGFWQVFRAI